MATHSNSDVTPLMQQYFSLKKEAEDALLFFRMGDFYELFNEDAILASRLLEITLTSRDKNKESPTPMAGVPHHSASGYIHKLLKLGKKVAIAEQFENPTDKKLVERKIVRVLTPALHFETDLEKNSHFLAVLLLSDVTFENSSTTAAWLELSTGHVYLRNNENFETILEELSDPSIKQVIVLGKIKDEISVKIEEWCGSIKNQALVERLPSSVLPFDRAKKLVQDQYEISDLSAFCPSDAAVIALGMLFETALKAQRLERLTHVKIPEQIQSKNNLRFGPKTIQHLDLFPNQDGTPSLYSWLNTCKTSMGSRMLRQWIARPLSNTAKIKERQMLITELGTLTHSEKHAIRNRLESIYDLERLTSRVSTKIAHPRDLRVLGESILSAKQTILELELKGKLLEICSESKKILSSIESIAQRITFEISENAPILSREGGIFNSGHYPELDRLIKLATDGQSWLLDLEQKERSETGISSLKVRYNRVFGYYIEVTSAHLGKVPARYHRKQTMVGAERFFTEELKQFEQDFVSAAFKQKQLEFELFTSLVEQVSTHLREFQNLTEKVALIDVLLCLSENIGKPGWTMPAISVDQSLDLTQSKHPIVDEALGGQFIHNDIHLDDSDNRMWIITGPNMGGKSTLLRQVALTVVLGQMGAPVPAATASWGVFSSIYTRIGANDAIARGQSTFMVEMTELAHLLAYADQRSLIVLDEVGRGTSTFDGMAVAGASLEWIAKKIKARGFFSTHYHELTDLGMQLPGVKNRHMQVQTSDERLRFLYKLAEGPSEKSFGIEVAKMAGLPKEVISRATSIQNQLEKQSPSGKQEGPPEPKRKAMQPLNQLNLF